MTDEKAKLLKDIIDCISSINEHLEGRRVFEEYSNSKTRKRAVERELEIIGEAVNRLLKIDPTVKISYARQIVDLRNKIIHAYDTVNDTVIWSIVMNHLPKLRSDVDFLLNIEDFNNPF